MAESKRKQGGQPKYTIALGDQICDLIAQGRSVRSVAREVGVPHPTIFRWAASEELAPGFPDQYARARDDGYRLLADEILEIADDTSHDTRRTEGGNEVADSEWISRSKLRVDTRRWLLSKMLPKEFGDKVAVGGGQGGDGPIELEVRVNVVKPGEAT